jgi:hypothetical protein
MYGFALFRRFAELLTEFEYAGRRRKGRFDVNTVKTEQRNEKRVQIIVNGGRGERCRFCRRQDRLSRKFDRLVLLWNLNEYTIMNMAASYPYRRR